jgi:excisionase family DNA binding protein
MQHVPTDNFRRALEDALALLPSDLAQRFKARRALEQIALNDPSPPPEYLTTADLQHRFQVSRSTILRWVKAGHLPPPAKYGALLRWRRADLDNYTAPVTA